MATSQVNDYDMFERVNKMLMKEFVDFSKEFERRIEDRCEEGVSVKFHNVTKNNGVILHGITILSGKNMAPTFYEESFYEIYKKEEDMEKTVDNFFYNYFRECPVNDFDLDFFTDYEKVKENICYKVINKNKNVDLLQKIPHISFLNLAICFYYSTENIGKSKGSILIYNEHMEMWKTNTQELYQYASVNTPKKMPAERVAIQDMIKDITDEEMIECIPPEDNLYIMTNSERNYGAMTLFYPGVLEETSQFFNGSFYIIPSSIHELLIMRDSGLQDEEYLKEMVQCVNTTAVSEEEYLSNHPYYYDAQLKKLRQL